MQTTIPFDKLLRIGFLDPAGGKRTSMELKRVRARSAIIVIGVDVVASRVFVLYSWADRCTTDQMIDQLFHVHKRFQTKMFGIEANALQYLFATAIQREARQRGIKVPIIPVDQPARVDKDDRIRAELQPLIHQGRLFVQKNHHELITEMRGFPTAKTKDMVDALASAVHMMPKKTIKQARSDEGRALAQYLRDSGAPDWYIQQEMRRSDN